MEEQILADLETALAATLEAFRREAMRLRTGRAHAALLDGVRVDYYGAETPLNQIASVTVVDPRLIQVKPWERQMCPAVEKAIFAANLGVTPTNRGDVVLVPVPPPTGDRRREMVKVLHKLAEEARVSARHGRREAMDLLELDEDMPDDDLHRAKKKVQDATDAAVKRIDQVSADKEAEILEV
ncbi:MAG: ribosome recycling factor [Myxococcales bacterium]|nr:ribosome recycling factor [Myxococcales bacterium]